MEVLQLALPLVVAGLASRLSTLIHAAIVANEPTAGQSVAAVIVAGLTFILITIPVTSIAVGVQALVSRKAGADEMDGIGPIVTTGLLLSASCASVLTVAAYFAAPVLFPLIDSTVAISDEAVKYLNVRLLSMPAFVIVQIAAAVFIGLNHPSRSFMVLVGMLLLDTAVAAYLVPTLGVEGAAVGSFVGEAVAMLLFLAQWPGFAKQQGIRLAAATNEVVRGLFKVVGPISVRRLMRPLQVVLLVWILGLLNSPVDLIVGTLLIKLSLLAQAPGGAFGKAAAVLAAHDLGGEKIRRARKRPKDALIAAMAIMGTLAVLGALFPDVLLGVFLKTDAQLDAARWPFRVVCLAIPMMTVTGVYATTLLAIGASRTVAWMAVVLRFGIALPLTYLFAVYWNWGVLGVVAVDAAMSLVRMVLSLQAIARPRWTQIQKGDIDPAQIDDGM